MSNKYFRLSSFGSYVLTPVLFFVIGLYAAKLSGAGKNQMLAGGAIVLMWGVLFAGIGLFTSLVLISYIQVKNIIRINWIMLLIVLGLFAFTYVTFSKKEKHRLPENVPARKPTAPAPNSELMANAITPLKYTPPPETELQTSAIPGIGFFKPDLTGNPTIYFYSRPDYKKTGGDLIPTDSIVFTADPYGNPTTSYAPPWLYPEHLKLDYGILYFKAKGLGRNWVEVEVNKQSGQLLFLDKSKGTYLDWAEFLLTVNSVEFRDGIDGTIHIKPLENAALVKIDFEFMHPLLVQNDWLYVALIDDNYEENGKGWMRWRKEGKLLISYSLLS